MEMNNNQLDIKLSISENPNKDIPENPNEDTLEQRRMRMRLDANNFLETWKQHSTTLSPERKQTIEKLLTNDKKALQAIGYSFLLKGWKPKTDLELAIYNGNPYTINKPDYCLYDEVEKLQNEIDRINLILKKLQL